LLYPEEAGTEDQGNFSEAFSRQLQNYIAPILFIGLLLSSLSSGSSEQREVRLFYPFSIFLSLELKKMHKSFKVCQLLCSDKLSRVQEQAFGTWLG
jgi:hypothetical protein